MQRFYNTFQNLKGSKFFRKVLFSFIVTFSIIFFIFFFLIMGYLNQNYREDKIRTNNSQLSHAEQITTNLLRDIYTHTSVLFTDDQNMLSLLYGATWDNTTEIKAIDAINRIQNSSNYIHSVYIINFNVNKVMTNLGFYNLDNFYDQELLEQLRLTTPSTSPSFFLPRSINRYASYSNYTGGTYEKIWSLIYYSNQAGAMVINISHDSFAELLDVSSQDNSAFFLLNNKQQILTSSDNTIFGNTFWNTDLLEQLEQQPKDNGDFTTTNNGKKYTVSYTKNSSFGLVSLKLEPYTVFDYTNQLLGISFGISLLYVIISLVLAFITSSFLYKPVNLLKLSVLEKLPEILEKSDGDEFSMFSKAYENIMLRNSHLKKYMFAYLSQFQERELLKFLQGSISAITPASYMDISILFDKNKFQIVIIELDTQREDNSQLTGNPDNLELIMFSISNVADELFLAFCSFRRIESNYSRLVYILNFNEMHNVHLEDALKKLHSFVNEHFHVSFSIGVSSIVSEFDDLPAAKIEAEDSLNRRFVSGFNSIHLFNEKELPSKEEQVYPFEIEQELLNALKNLNEKKIPILLDQFFQAISTYPYSQTHLYLMWLNYNIQRFEYFNNPDAHPLDITSVHILPEFRTLLERQCLSIIQFMEHKKTMSGERLELIERLNTLIDENICDPNLSVVYLASEVHMSVNYLRSIYKEQTGNSLSGFITQKKLELIYELLLQTNMTIQDISDKLGFTTKNYFFTFFKKHTGMTPSQYRKIHKLD